jgi:predicted O-methyltransferase YrrM
LEFSASAKRLVGRALRKGLAGVGYEIQRTFLGKLPPDMVEDIEKVREFTMTSSQRLAALGDAVDYVLARGIPGAFVECGVWRGGSGMMMAHRLMRHGKSDRELYLYDTFDGMSEPTEFDIQANSGKAAADLLASADKSTAVWAYSPLDDVKRNLARTGYPDARLHFVVGKVEDTIPAEAPEQIALLRLDTDWYESTRHELEHLYPRLAPGGVLIIDDYGHWEGARRAVDEYLAAHDISLLLNRIDYTGRIALKT